MCTFPSSLKVPGKPCVPLGILSSALLLYYGKMPPKHQPFSLALAARKVAVAVSVGKAAQQPSLN